MSGGISGAYSRHQKLLIDGSVCAFGDFSLSVQRFESHCRDEALRLFLIIVSKNLSTQSRQHSSDLVQSLAPGYVVTAMRLETLELKD
jgi:hypothetical protein